MGRITISSSTTMALLVMLLSSDHELILNGLERTLIIVKNKGIVKRKVKQGIKRKFYKMEFEKEM